MKLQIGIPTAGQDLASLLHDDEGLFLCQNGGRNFITGTKHGHSIVFGPMPVGRAVREENSGSLTPEPWVVTKISHNPADVGEFTRAYSSGGQGGTDQGQLRR